MPLLLLLLSACSIPSLLAGLGSAGVISICSYASLQNYHAGKSLVARSCEVQLQKQHNMSVNTDAPTLLSMVQRLPTVR
jgi:hypothetical protein